jgi:UDP-glucose 4-epimerase
VRVLVTGGAGFIGGRVARACLEAGHQVTVLDDLSSGSRERVPAGADFVDGDLTTLDLDRLVRDHSVDAVDHHAAHIDLRESVRDPVADARINILGSLRLFEACRRGGVRRIVFASTGGAIYGEPRSRAADESHPTDPVSPYGVAKLAVEKYLNFYRVEHGFVPAVLRYANVYGPGQSGAGEAGVVAIFLERMLSGRTPFVHGDGGQSRDFVYVEDCVRANLAVLSDERSGVWNVGTGVETTVNELYDVLSELSGFRVPASHDAPAPGEQRRSVLDGSRLLRDFRLPAYTPLREGLADTVEAFRAAASGPSRP